MTENALYGNSYSPSKSSWDLFNRTLSGIKQSADHIIHRVGMRLDISLLLLVILALYPTIGHTVDNPKDNASWWINKYGALESNDNVLVARAEKVFDRVRSAADKTGSRYPRLIVINKDGNPWAISTKDGSVILSRSALSICYRANDLERGDSRIAFVFGHELSHLAKDDFWHAAAFSALLSNSNDLDQEQKEILSLFRDITDANPYDAKASEAAKLKELQADSNGLIYMTIAGYEPKIIVGSESTDFFREWVGQITGNIAYADARHPTPQQRAEFVRSQLANVVESLSLYQFGVRFHQLGRYNESLTFLEYFKEKYPGREVFNNIGLVHYQLAAKELSKCNTDLILRFQLPTVLDVETLAEKFKRRGVSSASACRNNRMFQKHIKEAIRYYSKASEMDPSYLPSRINLSSAEIINGNYLQALGIADNAFKIDDKSADALNNKAVASYLYGETQGTNTVDRALEILKALCNKSYNAACYNLGSILTEIGRDSAATEAWKKYTAHDQNSPFANHLFTNLGIKLPINKVEKRKPIIPPPIPLGQIGYGQAQLKDRMKQTKFVIGQLKGSVFENDKIKVLVIDDAIELVEENAATHDKCEMITDKYAIPSIMIQSGESQILVYDDVALETKHSCLIHVVWFGQKQ